MTNRSGGKTNRRFPGGGWRAGKLWKHSTGRKWRRLLKGQSGRRRNSDYDDRDVAES